VPGRHSLLRCLERHLQSPHREWRLHRAGDHYANLAYRNAMPRLVGYENIRDFVACVAEGLLLGAITDSQSSRLLYAAQVAQGTLRYQPIPKPSAS
jgi:hypothetical protein